MGPGNLNSSRNQAPWWQNYHYSTKVPCLKFFCALFHFLKKKHTMILQSFSYSYGWSKLFSSQLHINLYNFLLKSICQWIFLYSDKIPDTINFQGCNFYFVFLVSKVKSVGNRIIIAAFGKIDIMMENGRKQNCSLRGIRDAEETELSQNRFSSKLNVLFSQGFDFRIQETEAGESLS